MIGYRDLAYLAWRKNYATDSNPYANTIPPALFVLGFLIDQQVRRIRALLLVGIPARPEEARSEHARRHPIVSIEQSRAP